ncbi:unnamed protein product, partial [Mesorhabditis spiculigera]
MSAVGEPDVRFQDRHRTFGSRGKSSQLAYVWLGANRTGPDKYDITWLDGTSVSYSNYDPAVFDDWHGVEPCLQIDMSNMWNDAGCGVSAHLICQKPVKWIDPDGNEVQLPLLAG